MNGMPALKDSHAIPGTPSSRLKEKQEEKQQQEEEEDDTDRRLAGGVQAFFESFLFTSSKSSS